MKVYMFLHYEQVKEEAMFLDILIDLAQSAELLN